MSTKYYINLQMFSCLILLAEVFNLTKLKVIEILRILVSRCFIIKAAIIYYKVHFMKKSDKMKIS